MFTGSNVAVNFFDFNKPVSPSEISKYITEQITLRFQGDRKAAEKWALQKIKTEFGVTERAGLKKLALFFAFCVNPGKLSSSQKKKIKDLIRKKVQDEFEYINLCKEIDFDKVINLK
jgi:hypothetical protein